MYKKIVISAAAAAAVVGAGGTALAVTGSDTTSGTAQPAASSSTSTSTSPSGKTGKTGKAGKAKKAKKGNALLRRLEHGTIVTKGKGGAVTHDLIRGDVSAVSATSVTVRAADGKSETFTVTKDTKVRVRADGKGAASTISKIAKGDHVLVTGTGTTTLSAKHILDVKGK